MAIEWTRRSTILMGLRGSSRSLCPVLAALVAEKLGVLAGIREQFRAEPAKVATQRGVQQLFAGFVRAGRGPAGGYQELRPGQRFCLREGLELLAQPERTRLVPVCHAGSDRVAVEF